MRANTGPHVRVGRIQFGGRPFWTDKKLDQHRGIRVSSERQDHQGGGGPILTLLGKTVNIF